MAEQKKSAKRISNHLKRRMKYERNDKVGGYEYQMNQQQYDYLLSKDGGNLKDVKEIIKYLNQVGNYKERIVKLSVF